MSDRNAAQPFMSRYTSTTDAPYAPDAFPPRGPVFGLVDCARQMIRMQLGMIREEAGRC